MQYKSYDNTKLLDPRLTRIVLSSVANNAKFDYTRLIKATLCDES